MIKKIQLKYLINLDWISYHYQRDTWLSQKFFNIFGKKRSERGEITDHHKNIAAALQDRLEEVVLFQLRLLKKKTKTDYLCISGGVGLNCSLNGKIKNLKFLNKYLFNPASGDAGTTYGACLLSELRNNKNSYIKKN